eukprot:c1395_g1_i1 orf=148-867(-)
MPPKADSIEGIVLNFMNEQNRPLNVQNVADSLQKYGIKKAAAQKALDILADSSQVSFKEYGKQKIYLAQQDQFQIPNAEELEVLKRDNERLQKEVQAEKSALLELETELQTLESNLTLEQIKEREQKLRDEVVIMENKLNKLREGTVLVTPEDRQKVHEMYNLRINQWKKRKRIFKDLWDMITEALPKDLKEFKEELGIEYDEDVSVNIQDYCNIPVKKQMVRGDDATLLLVNGKRKRV